MAFYRKKPIKIEAYQTDKEIKIETLEGVMTASVGDYIITGVNGEKYPCKPDIFEKTYDGPIESTTTFRQYLGDSTKENNPSEIGFRGVMDKRVISRVDRKESYQMVLEKIFVTEDKIEIAYNMLSCISGLSVQEALIFLKKLCATVENCTFYNE